MKIIKSLTLLVSIILILTNCNKKKVDNEYIVVSIDPQHYFLQQIIKDKYKIETLIPAGVNPESYDPTPSQMILLNNSSIFFKLGYLGIEDILLDKITKDNSIVVDCSKGIEILGHNCEGHDHQHNSTNGHDAGDPHYWTSTTNAKIILSNMLSGMIAFDSIHTDYYQDNYNQAIQRIDSIENFIKDTLSNSQSKSFIIYHPALTYYAQENDLKQFSIEYEGKIPSPKQLKNVVDSGLINNVKVVFIQKEFDIKNAEIIATQLKADTCSIDLLSYDWPSTMLQITKKIAQ